MTFYINDRVYVKNPKLATYKCVGTILYFTEDGLAAVSLEDGDVQYRSGKITKVVKYKLDNLGRLHENKELFDEYIESFNNPIEEVVEEEIFVGILWHSPYSKSFDASEIFDYYMGVSKDDVKEMVANRIESIGIGYFWLSIVKEPSRVTIENTPTLVKVNEGDN